jgi:Rieske Fe-S protein
MLLVATASLSCSGGAKHVVALGPVSSIQVNSPVHYPRYHVYLVRSSDTAEGSPTVHAFSDVSPWMGCAIQWQPDRMFGGLGTDSRVQVGVFTDVCAGGLFSVDGSYLYGPSPSNLNEFPVTLEPDGTVRVDLDDEMYGAHPPTTSATPCEAARAAVHG